MSRIPYLTTDELDEKQRRVFDHITGGKRSNNRPVGEFLTKEGGLRGPFNAMLYSPEMGDVVQSLGEQVRFSTSFDGRLRELAILNVAADWHAQFEWWAHAKIARREGLADDVIESIKAGKRPAFANDDEAVVHDFARELLDTRHVSSDRYQRALELLGERGVVELVVLLGYYTIISMTLNTFEIPLPEGEQAPFSD